MMNKLVSVIGGGSGGGPPPPLTPAGMGSGQHSIVLNRAPSAKSASYVEQRQFGVVLKHQFEAVNRQAEHGLALVKRTCLFVEAVLKCLDNSGDARRLTGDLMQRWQEEPIADEMAHFSHATTLINEVMLSTWAAHDKFRKAATAECVTPLHAFYKTAQGRRRELVKDNARMIAVWSGVEEALSKERRECAKAYSEMRLAQDAKDKEEMAETSKADLFPKLVKKWKSAKEVTVRKFAAFEKSYEKAHALQLSNDAVSTPSMLAELEQIERDRLRYLADYLAKFQLLFADWASEVSSSSDLVSKVIPALQIDKSMTSMLDKFTGAFGPPPTLVPVRYDLPCTSNAVNSDALPADSAPLMAYLLTSSSGAPLSSFAPPSASSPPPFPVTSSGNTPPRAHVPPPFPTAAGRGPTATTPAAGRAPLVTTAAPLPKAAIPQAIVRPLPVAATPVVVASGPLPPPLPTATGPPPLPTLTTASSGGPPPLPSSVTAVSPTAAVPSPTSVAASPRPPPVPITVVVTPAAAATPKPKGPAVPAGAIGVFTKNTRAPPPSLPQKRKPKAAGDIDVDPSDLPPPPLPPLVTSSTPSYRLSISHPQRRASIARQSVSSAPGVSLPPTAFRLFPAGLPAMALRKTSTQATPEPSSSPIVVIEAVTVDSITAPSPSAARAQSRGPPPLPGSTRTSVSGPPPLPASVQASLAPVAEPTPAPASEPAPQSQSQPEPQPQPAAQSEPQLESQPELQSQLEAQPEQQLESQPSEQTESHDESATVVDDAELDSLVLESAPQPPNVSNVIADAPLEDESTMIDTTHEASADEVVDAPADQAEQYDEEADGTQQPEPLYAVALFDFALLEDTEDIHYLAFSAGDEILVHSYPEGEDWWFGEARGDVGFFAANYCQFLSADNDNGGADSPEEESTAAQ